MYSGYIYEMDKKKVPRNTNGNKILLWNVEEVFERLQKKGRYLSFS